MVLSGKTELVTGASRGLGRVVAYRLARDGARVAINYAQQREEAESLASEIRELGGTTAVYQCSVADVGHSPVCDGPGRLRNHRQRGTPGLILTDMTAGWISTQGRSDVIDGIERVTMVRRVGRPEEIAHAVQFLACAESAFITAQTLTVDGGRMGYIAHP